ncbi:hypothetical protein HIM_01394 [Hirsutella minnesotensis 3608]|nr:hypothetical protein HIM_01394 [Hirsutella minnesotensis 3608]
MAASPDDKAVPYRQIRALYDDKTITVYQAYSEEIALAAVAAQRLSAAPAFRTGRMTWIKPSWAWMLYRSGYSYKDAGQRRILALRMRRAHFVALLEQASLSSRPDRDGDRPVRVQWDPERTVRLERATWASEWIEAIDDVTDRARALKQILDERPDVTLQELVALGLVPPEHPFPLPDAVAAPLGMNNGQGSDV